MLWFADSVSYLLPPPFDSLAINLSLIGHFKPMVQGSVFVSDIGYFVTASCWRCSSPPAGWPSDERPARLSDLPPRTTAVVTPR